MQAHCKLYKLEGWFKHTRRVLTRECKMTLQGVHRTFPYVLWTATRTLHHSLRRILIQSLESIIISVPNPLATPL